ncbi:MAG: hypothetical protein LBH11_00895 [Propionibacteriaceae bacterium]|jgi:hypothetical protein|nr:hypothetical protein [Propionibacteriaceae bacterium]
MAGKVVRKTLGDWREPYAQQLMALIGTQSKATIATWCVGYAAEHFLPIWQTDMPGDDRPAAALAAARSWLAGEIKLPEAKPVILACHAAARESEGNGKYAALAAARACGQSASVIHSASHSIGMLWYGAAAVAYATVGVGQPAEVYARIAADEGWRQLAALEGIAVPDEPRPAKIKWVC